MGKGDDDGVRWPRNSTHEPTLNTFPWCFYVTKTQFFVVSIITLLLRQR